MNRFRTSFVVAAAVATLSITGVSRADNDVDSKKSTTTKTQSTSKTKSGSASDTKSSKTQSSGTSGATDTSGTSSGTSGTTGSDMKSDTPGMQPMSPSGTGTTSGSTTTGTGIDTTQPSSSSMYGTTPGVTDTTAAPPPTTVMPPETQTTTTSTTTTTSADYDANVGAERGYEVRPNRPLLITGVAIFGGTYAASAIVGAASGKDYDEKLYIPLVGPWLDLADRPCGLGDCGNAEDWNQALLIGSGIAQGVGVGLALASLFIPEEHRPKQTAASPAARSIAASKPQVKVLPMTVRSGSGVGAVGVF